MNLKQSLWSKPFDKIQENFISKRINDNIYIEYDDGTYEIISAKKKISWSKNENS